MSSPSETALNGTPLSTSPEQPTANHVSPFVREAIRRMHAAPVSFFTEEQRRLLDAYDGPIVSGDPLGRIPENL